MDITKWSLENMKKRIEQFNKANPVGTVVGYFSDNGIVEYWNVRAPAFVLEGIPWVYLSKSATPVLLRRVGTILDEEGE